MSSRIWEKKPKQHAHTGSDSQAFQLGIFFVKLTFRSFIGISIQILIFLLAFPSTELGAPVLRVSTQETKFRKQNYQSNQ